MSKFIDRTGEENYNNFGSKMKIILCEGRKVKVYFEQYKWTSDYIEYATFKRGNVKCPYEPRLYNIGYLGEGKYNCKDYEKIYDAWKRILRRCYDPYYLNKYPTYRDCYVCELWHCYQNFAKWYEENYYEIENERMELDKDITHKGNKIYSPEYCVFVPKRINQLFIKRQNNRGDYPIGVTYRKGEDVLEARCSVYKNGKSENKHLGKFPLNKPFQTFTCYKQFKETYIKQVAEEYKNLIPKKLYNALYNYRIEIND